jgi:hypothetical protein
MLVEFSISGKGPTALQLTEHSRGDHALSGQVPDCATCSLRREKPLYPQLSN